jgi:hypothetical protein
MVRVGKFDASIRFDRRERTSTPVPVQDAHEGAEFCFRSWTAEFSRRTVIATVSFSSAVTCTLSLLRATRSGADRESVALGWSLAHS